MIKFAFFPAGSCQEDLPHGLQRGEGGLHKGGQQQGGSLSDSRTAEEDPREGGQVQAGQSEGESTGLLLLPQMYPPPPPSLKKDTQLKKGRKKKRAERKLAFWGI